MTTRTNRKPALTEAEREDAVRLIKEEYFNFLLSGPKQGEEGDAKTVGARHATGKVILAHLELAAKSGGPAAGDDAAATGEAVAGHLGAARAAMASLEGEGADTDDDDAGDG